MQIQHQKRLILFLFVLSLFFFLLGRFGFLIPQYLQYWYFSSNCPDRTARYPDFGIRVPAHFEVHGIDVSHYVCSIDWEEVRKMQDKGIQIRFAFMRATMGMNGVDFEFQNNWKEARNHQILRGAYHYFYPDESGAMQASNFLNSVSLEKGDLPPVLDIEEVDPNIKPADLYNGIQTWLHLVEASTGVKPIIYTNVSIYKTHIINRFEDYPIWIASYRDTLDNFPSNRRWTFWQHHKDGQVNGVSEKVDFNVFNGSWNDLEQLKIKN